MACIGSVPVPDLFVRGQDKGHAERANMAKRVLMWKGTSQTRDLWPDRNPKRRLSHFVNSTVIEKVHKLTLLHVESVGMESEEI